MEKRSHSDEKQGWGLSSAGLSSLFPCTVSFLALPTIHQATDNGKELFLRLQILLLLVGGITDFKV